MATVPSVPAKSALVSRDSVTETARRLCGLSRRHFASAHDAIDWPASVERDQWFMSPELISIYGTPAWVKLGERERKVLSFWEAVNFFSLNISGEKALIQGIATRLYSPGLEDVTEYLHHFLDEENKHSVWFGTFCLRYAHKVYPPLQVAFPTRFSQSEEDILFFARIAVFEEIVDRYNSMMGEDDRLVPVARQINALHHADEARHLVFGRNLVEHLWRRDSPSWAPDRVSAVRCYLRHYVIATWRDYYNRNAYRDAGLDNAWALARETWDSALTGEHRRTMSARCLSFLVESGVLDREPEL